MDQRPRIGRPCPVLRFLTDSGGEGTRKGSGPDLSLSYNLDAMPMLIETGAVDFDEEVNSSLLPSHLAGCLRSVDADAVEVADNLVTFRGGIFRVVTNWNVLVPFGFGDLTVDSEAREIRYRLSYRQLAIFSTAIVGIVAALVLTFSSFRRSYGAILALSLMWFVAAFVRAALGASRFQRLISRAVATAPRISAHS